ncbi:MAG TPA: VWA domain-containing protein [Candidatus Limnocylindrales bacterium]|nr:VWA domain-containing protein [Candidatus Limnocylindrales bacterium]
MQLGPAFVTGILVVSAIAPAAEDTPTFKTAATLVKVETYVYDRKTNAPIAGLTAADFVVHDESEPRDIAYFGDASGPLDLVFLMDVSGSMREVVPDIAAAAAGALAHLDPTDRAAVLAFGKHTAVEQPLTGDPDAVVQGLRRILNARVGTDTDINQAVWSAADYLHGAAGAVNRAIVVMTDNEQVTAVPDALVDEQLFEAGAVLDGLLVRGAVPMPHITHPGILHFAARTGGDVLEGSHPGARLDEMIRRIKARYVIHFKPVRTDASGARRIRVELTPEARRRYPNAVVRARTSYFPNSRYQPVGAVLVAVAR